MSLPSRSLVKHVFLANVEMEGIADKNKLPRTFNRKQADANGDLKISKQSDDFNFGEIYCRDNIENPVYFVI